MAREYFCAYHSYLEAMEALTDAQIGRLFKACLIYSKTGTTPQLSGNERLLFPAFKGQIDRDIAQYEKKRQTNRENASMRWHATACDRMPDDAKHAKEKEKEKEKTKEKSILSPLPPKGDKGMDRMDFDPDEVLDDLHEQVDYDILLADYPREDVDELLNIMLDAICDQGEYEKIGARQLPRAVVRKRMLSLEYEHIVSVLDNRGKSHGQIKNIRAYLLAMLYNAPTTCSNEMAALFNFHEQKGRA